MRLSALLFQLPISVGRSVLSNWLSVECLSALDVAYCNHDERSNFLDLLAGSELSSRDCEFDEPSTLSKLAWITTRKTKCSEFHSSVRVTTDEECSILSAFLALTAPNMKVVVLDCDANTIQVILDTLAVNKCVLEALLVTPTNIGNVEMPRVFKSIVTILSNSASKITEFEVHSLLNLALHLEDGIVFPALKDVHFRPVSDADLVRLASAAPNLQLLDITHPRCSDVGLAAIARCCAHVTTFLLAFSRHLEHIDEGVAAIAMCPKLRVICLSECTNLTNNGLTAVVTRCIQLEELIVESQRVTDAPFVSLAHSANAKTLKCLVFNNCTAVTGTGIVAIATHCTALETLSSNDARFLASASIMLAIPHMKRVTNLSLRYHQVDDAMLVQIADHMPQLHYLDITPDTEISSFTSTGLMFVAMKCEKLYSLDMGRAHHAMHNLAIALWKKLRPGLTFCNLRAVQM